jgi:hypothetical protein
MQVLLARVKSGGTSYKGQSEIIRKMGRVGPPEVQSFAVTFQTFNGFSGSRLPRWRNVLGCLGKCTKRSRRIESGTASDRVQPQAVKRRPRHFRHPTFTHAWKPVTFGE